MNWYHLIISLVAVVSAIFLVFFFRRQAAGWNLLVDPKVMTIGYETIFKFANDAIILYDNDLNILQVNEKAVDQYGYSREDLLKMKAVLLRAETVRHLLREKLNRVAEMGGEMFETLHMRKDGTVFPVEVSTRCIRVGRKIYFQSIVRDIELRKRAEGALLESEQRMKLISNSMPQIVWTAKSSGEIDFFNSRFEEITGVYPFRPDAYERTIHPEDLIRVRRQWFEGMVREIAFTFEIRLHIKSGVYHWFLCKAIPLHDDKRNVVKWYCSATDINDLKTTQKALEKSLSHLYLAQQIAGLGYWRYSPGSRTFEGSGEMLRILGLPPVSVWNSLDLLMKHTHPDDVPVVAENLKNAESGNDAAFFFRMRRGDETRHLFMQVHPQFDEQGTVSEVFGVMQDRTEQVGREREIHEAHQQLLHHFENTPLAVIEWDPDFRITRFSRHAEELFGHSQEELLNRHPFDWNFFHRDDRPRIREGMKRLSERQDPRSMWIARNYNKDGKILYCEWYNSALVDHGGSLISILTLVHNVTEQQRAEQALLKLNAELEERVIRRTAELSDLYNHAPCGYHALDRHGKITMINDTELSWLGYSRDEIVNKLSFSEMLTERCRGIYEQHFIQLLKSGNTASVQVDLVRKDGTVLPAIVNERAVMNDAGKFLMSRSTVTDHTDRLNFETEILKLNQILQNHGYNLEKANRELEAFSYSVSHDLRAPLRAINGFSKILLEDHSKKLDEEGRRLLQIVMSNSQRMGQLIDDLLRFSRTSRQELTINRINMHDLFASLSDEIMQYNPSQLISIDIGTMPDAWGDLSLLKQVVSNLLSNAVKFSARKELTEIRISGIKNESETVYSISDNGTGFDMKYAGKLFGVFQRLHGMDEFQGNGVGLALVKRIIDKHGGRVWAESALEQGATFFFSLPEQKIHLT